MNVTYSLIDTDEETSWRFGITLKSFFKGNFFIFQCQLIGASVSILRIYNLQLPTIFFLYISEISELLLIGPIFS